MRRTTMQYYGCLRIVIPLCVLASRRPISAALPQTKREVAWFKCTTMHSMVRLHTGGIFVLSHQSLLFAACGEPGPIISPAPVLLARTLPLDFGEIDLIGSVGAGKIICMERVAWHETRCFDEHVSRAYRSRAGFFIESLLFAGLRNDAKRGLDAW
ncbi:hypothetical protein V8C37DRAFT_395177 [Trichoderma ceciliae]